MNQMKRAVEALRVSKKIVFFTGAGISADSGIPTFRDKLTGFWSKYDPRRLETADAFRENPALVWGWYLWRRNQVRQAWQRSRDGDEVSSSILGGSISALSCSLSGDPTITTPEETGCAIG